MEMHSQECWLPADNGACVAAMTLKSQKTRPKFFQDFQSSNQHGTVVKSQCCLKNVRFMGTVSGPAGCLCNRCRSHMIWHGFINQQNCFIRRNDKTVGALGPLSEEAPPPGARPKVSSQMWPPRKSLEKMQWKSSLLEWNKIGELQQSTHE